MLIKDLSIELDANAMTAVHGGGNVTQGNVQSNVDGGAAQFTETAFSLGTSNVNVSAPTQTNLAQNTAFNSDIDVTKIDVTKVALFGSLVG
jgi:hypothetical protein